MVEHERFGAAGADGQIPGFRRVVILDPETGVKLIAAAWAGRPRVFVMSHTNSALPEVLGLASRPEMFSVRPADKTIDSFHKQFGSEQAIAMPSEHPHEESAVVTVLHG